MARYVSLCVKVSKMWLQACRCGRGGQVATGVECWRQVSRCGAGTGAASRSRVIRWLNNLELKKRGAEE